MRENFRLVWKTKNEITQSDKDAIHSLAMNFYPEGRAAYARNYWYSSIEPDALLILYDKGKMISYSKYIMNKVSINNEEKVLAGFSLLTHGEYQGKGIAGMMVEELKRSMHERGVDILYATTIFPQVEHILQKRGFLQLTQTVLFTSATTGKITQETEKAFIFSEDKIIRDSLQDLDEFYIGRGPM